MNWDARYFLKLFRQTDRTHKFKINKKLGRKIDAADFAAQRCKITD